jgi:hypothetical protein
MWLKGNYSSIDIPANLQYTFCMKKLLVISLILSTFVLVPSMASNNKPFTALGTRFYPAKAVMAAAHTTLPFGTKLLVTNLKNNHQVEVVVDARLPSNSAVVIQISPQAADVLGMPKTGSVPLRVVPEIRYRNDPAAFQKTRSP